MKYLFIILFFIPLFAAAQPNCKTAPVEIFIVKAKESEKKIARTKGRIMVVPVGDFDDSSLLYINDVLIFARYLQTDPLFSHSHYSISVSKKAANGKALLKMWLWNKKICFTSPVNFKYPVLEIRYYDNKWILTYTDRVVELE
ncbi:MAG TPA: hypothetical protein VGO58_04770 [Chitinophagaceae bacterium]|jgi:hypothetical protein|nr:hypothetical protein [Chitinophagaceae bacterium]